MRSRPTLMGMILGPLLIAVSAACRADDRMPDPRALLREVERDRLAIAPGTLRLDLSITEAARPRDPYRTHLMLTFDGPKCRVDQDRRQLYISWIGDRAGKFDQRNRLLESWGGPDGVVAAGLGEWDETRTREIFDGTTLMGFTEPTRSAFVSRRRSANALFNPRVLGLTDVINAPALTPTALLVPRSDEAVTLIGAEVVGGTTTWHVSINAGAKRSERHYWIEPAPGRRVIRVERRSTTGRTVVESEYAPAGPSDPGRLPVRVRASVYSPAGQAERESVLERPPGPIAADPAASGPATWTLAGLHLPIGQPVRDERAGDEYFAWDGTTLGTTPVIPPAQTGGPHRPPPAPQLLEVARREPTEPLASAAIAVLAAHHPSAREGEAALELLTKWHAGRGGVSEVGLRLMELYPTGAEALFRAVLARNPHRADQGLACMGLGEILKARSEQQGQVIDPAATPLFERAIAEFADVGWSGKARAIGDLARHDLADLRRLGIGQPVPPLEVADLDGRPLRLADYRGRVVVLAFWNSGCAPCLRAVPEERALAARWQGQPFALLGVNCDAGRAEAQATRSRLEMTWPSFWLEVGATAAREDWGLDTLGASSTYVIDARGTIRFHGLQGAALARAVESLMAEVNPPGSRPPER